MKNKITNILKHIYVLYTIYFHVFNFIIRFLGLFVKTEEKLILFTSFGGKKYDDSPKKIYEGMIKDERFKDYRFVWAFHEPERFKVDGADIIKTDTYTYFKTALKARCWITNSGIERGLAFKKKQTFYFNTWHGTPMKRMGTDISKNNESFSAKRPLSVDVMTAQGDFEADIFSRVFEIPKEKFLLCGLPRNDKLAKYSQLEKEKIKEKLHIPSNKKVILYAPTFREYERDLQHNCVLKPPIEISKWKEEISEGFVFLFRAHYEVAKVLNICDDDFVKDVSLYPSLNELMIIADVLISDYSSIFFDFSIMEKPMYHFTYDYEEYSQKRGMYFDIREQLNGANNENELIKILKQNDKKDDIEKTKRFRDKYVNYYGNATKMCLDCIIKNIGG